MLYRACMGLRRCLDLEEPGAPGTRMLTCQDASHLVSHGQDRALNLRERWALRTHLWMCGNCRRFERQIALMRRVLRRPDPLAEPDAADQTLSTLARERIGQALADQPGHRSKPPA